MDILLNVLPIFASIWGVGLLIWSLTLLYLFKHTVYIIKLARGFCRRADTIEFFTIIGFVITSLVFWGGGFLCEPIITWWVLGSSVGLFAAYSFFLYRITFKLQLLKNSLVLKKSLLTVNTLHKYS